MSGKYRTARAAFCVIAMWGGAAWGQVGEGWVEYHPERKIHLAEDDPKTAHKAIKAFPWTAHAAVGGDKPCATYDYDEKTDTETFRLLDPRSNRAEIRLANEYGTGSRQFEGYVTFFAPLNDESLFQVWGSDEGATQLMMRGYAASGGEIGIANFPVKGTPRVMKNCYGREIKVNVIHLQEDVGNKFVVYLDDKKVLEFPDNEHPKNHDGKNYHKYGCYGTLKTPEAVVKWRKVRHFKDGTAPAEEAAPAAGTRRASSPPKRGGEDAVLAADVQFDLKGIERERVIREAEAFLKEEPVTVTAAHSPRSAGGLHDFFSEGDYWWPNPKNPEGPYIQKDGETNPDNFVAHRHAMIRMSRGVGALASAYKLTGEQKYADGAVKHLKAWFVDDATKMNPDLQYAQAIKGITTGRGIGVIDTVHLIEPARAVMVLEKGGGICKEDAERIREWFSEYLKWMTTSKNGLDEMKAENNHGTCWVEQVAAFAQLVGDEEKMEMCRKRYKEVLLPKQMAEDGSFPRELKRTKPYGYSIFNADAMATVCWILSEGGKENLWEYEVEGKSMRKGVEYIWPYLADKGKWPLKPDVMFWEEWPVRSPVLLFGGLAYHERKYLETWRGLKAELTNEEVVRNVPIRNPLLWVD